MTKTTKTTTTATKTTWRLAAVAAFGMGLAAFGQQAVASADTESGATQDTARTAGPAAKAPAVRGGRGATAVKAPTSPAAAVPAPAAAVPSLKKPTAAVPSLPNRVSAPAPVTVATTQAPKVGSARAAVSTPPPTSTIATPYGTLGQWMINSKNQIADWVGIPQGGKTVLEGINVIVVDTASRTPAQSSANINVWMTRAGFGPSAVSSTGYQGIIGATQFSQQPTKPSAAFRDAYFLFANSHGRFFGPSPNPNGPGFIWTASLSEENLDLQNFSHGYESFDSARTKLLNNMVAIGAQNLGQVFMDNVYNVGDYTTGDADGFAAVIGVNQLLKAATPPRGGKVGPPKR
jgi:hypothetical protein